MTQAEITKPHSKDSKSATAQFCSDFAQILEICMHKPKIYVF